ncbi:hypothetical protein ACRAWD_24010 [Caulobacter segnis]
MAFLPLFFLNPSGLIMLAPALAEPADFIHHVHRQCRQFRWSATRSAGRNHGATTHQRRAVKAVPPEAGLIAEHVTRERFDLYEL